MRVERLWNALRYGDRQTKLSIGSVILFSFLAIILIIASCLNGRFYLFIIGMIFGVIAIIISQTFTLVDQSFVAQVNVKGKKESVKVYSTLDKKKEMQVDYNNQDDEDDTMSKQEDVAEQFDCYDEQTLKKMKKKFHVKKDHRPVIIDESKSYRIKECPAFIWRVHNKVYLLLLEKEPRKICIFRENIEKMDYIPNVLVNQEKDYKAFQKDNLITTAFEGYLPDYFHAKKGNYKYKNLYGIYPDIYFSNRSAAKIMDLLTLSFQPKDKITESKKLNAYFKRVYAANILYQDRVYSITEYKEAVEGVLGELCKADILQDEFQLTIDNLLKGKMISQQYADYYLQLKKHENQK